ncbi:MAG: hypothetical protein QF681_05855 [Vicinamibacterales bacterium]|jgi:hypothetical protein|nr:hypothetical protein [Vicinamibacterales bacterium]
MAGLAVVVLPRLDQFAAAEEPLDYVGSDVWTAQDGSFTIALPPKGSSTLRIGGTSGALRVQLEDVERLPRLTDLGDLELGEPIRFVATLGGRLDCRLRLVGPVGTAGVVFVEANSVLGADVEFLVPEPGHWLVWAECAGVEVDAVPPVVQVEPAGSAERIELPVG